MKKIAFAIIIMLAFFALSCESDNPVDDTGTTDDKPLVDLEPSTPVYSDPWDGTSVTEPSKDDGYYLIERAEHLAWVADQDAPFSDNIKFVANIDMNNEKFTGIESFSGIMDGNKKRIKKLSINTDDTDSEAGLVRKLTGGEIKNLIIESGDIKGYGSAGSFVGIVDNSSSGVTLTGLTNYANVETFKNSVISHAYAGGIIGAVSNSVVTITGVVNEGDVKAADTEGYSGGIVGVVESLGDNLKIITIEKAMNKGDITASVSSGGIVGIKNNVPNLIIKNVGNAGTVESTSTNNDSRNAGSGGILGFNNFSRAVTIEKSYNYKAVISSHSKGGILGFQNQNLAAIQMAITLSFYHEGNATAVGKGDATITGAEAISKSLFADSNTFSDWDDFDTVWEIKSGAEYPTLK